MMCLAQVQFLTYTFNRSSKLPKLVELDFFEMFQSGVKILGEGARILPNTKAMQMGRSLGVMLQGTYAFIRKRKGVVWREKILCSIQSKVSY